jgi:hypothetical protein
VCSSDLLTCSEFRTLPWKPHRKRNALFLARKHFISIQDRSDRLQPRNALVGKGAACASLIAEWYGPLGGLPSDASSISGVGVAYRRLAHVPFRALSLPKSRKARLVWPFSNFILNVPHYLTKPTLFQRFFNLCHSKSPFRSASGWSQ